MKKINDFPEKIEASDDDWLLIQDSAGITYKISRVNFLAGIETNGNSNNVELIFESVGDDAGLFYYLGTNQNTEAFINPVTRGSVSVTASSTLNSDFNPLNLINRDNETAHTNSEQNANFVIDLISNNFQLIDYTVRARTDNWSQIPRNWKLQGALESSDWFDIDEQVDVENFEQGDWLRFFVNSSEAYRKFRFIQTGPNNVSDYYLTLGEIEMYGIIS